MRVGVITTGFPRFDGDHSGSFLLTFVRHLVAHGHQARVLAPEPRQALTPPSWPGIEVRWVPYLRPRSLQRAFYGGGAPDNLRRKPGRWAGALSLSAALRMAAHHSLRDCDGLVSSWCVPSGWAASSVARGRAHLCICHATDLRWLGRVPGARTVARRVAQGATCMWFLSAAHRERFFEIAAIPQSSVPAHLGPMPIELPPRVYAERSAVRRRLGIEGTTLLFLGRLVPAKGVADLLLAMASMPDVGLCIAGDGPERKTLAALSQRLGVRARFEGWVAGERKEALLQACDALVVPSRGPEGLPTVLFEARARGLPIVASSAGAIADAFRSDHDVLLVPPANPLALRRGIERLRLRLSRRQLTV